MPSVRLLVDGLSPRRPGIEPTSVHVRLAVDKGAKVQGFLGVSVFSCQYQSTNAPYASSSECCSSQKDKRAKTVNFPISNALSAGGEHWMGKHLLLFIFQVRNVKLSETWINFSAFTVHKTDMLAR